MSFLAILAAVLGVFLITTAIAIALVRRAARKGQAERRRVVRAWICRTSLSPHPPGCACSVCGGFRGDR